MNTHQFLSKVGPKRVLNAIKGVRGLRDVVTAALDKATRAIDENLVNLGVEMTTQGELVAGKPAKAPRARRAAEVIEVEVLAPEGFRKKKLTGAAARAHKKTLLAAEAYEKKPRTTHLAASKKKAARRRKAGPTDAAILARAEQSFGATIH